MGAQSINWLGIENQAEQVSIVYTYYSWVQVYFRLYKAVIFWSTVHIGNMIGSNTCYNDMRVDGILLAGWEFEVHKTT